MVFRSHSLFWLTILTSSIILQDVRNAPVLHHTSQHQKCTPICPKIALIHTLKHELAQYPAWCWKNTPFTMFLCMVMDSHSNQVTSPGVGPILHLAKVNRGHSKCSLTGRTCLPSTVVSKHPLIQPTRLERPEVWLPSVPLIRCCFRSHNLSPNLIPHCEPLSLLHPLYP